MARRADPVAEWRFAVLALSVREQETGGLGRPPSEAKRGPDPLVVEGARIDGHGGTEPEVVPGEERPAHLNPERILIGPFSAPVDARLAGRPPTDPLGPVVAAVGPQKSVGDVRPEAALNSHVMGQNDAVADARQVVLKARSSSGGGNERRSQRPALVGPPVAVKAVVVVGRIAPRRRLHELGVLACHAETLPQHGSYEGRRVRAAKAYAPEAVLGTAKSEAVDVLVVERPVHPAAEAAEA